jgi:putative ABC transport system ATP-binding protein
MTVQARARRPAPVLDLRDVTKVYGTGETAVHALQGVTLTVERGDFVAIMGASGSGKSTLMNIIGCLDAPDAGRYLLDGIDVAGLDERSLTILRNRRIGFVFQSFNLIPGMSARATVELPLAYGGIKGADRRRRALAGRTIIVITHEDDVAAHAERVVRLVDGRIVEDVRRTPVTGPPRNVPWTTEGAR